MLSVMRTSYLFFEKFLLFITVTHVTASVKETQIRGIEILTNVFDHLGHYQIIYQNNGLEINEV